MCSQRVTQDAVRSFNDGPPDTAMDRIRTPGPQRLATDMKGSCLCGNVRYSLAGDPLAVVTCHCIHCQKQSGSALSVVVAVARKDLELAGELTTFEDRGTSGQPVFRKFCGKCGSPILTDTPRAEADGVIFIKGGTIDDAATLLRPTVHYWTERKHDWLALPVDDLILKRE